MSNKFFFLTNRETNVTSLCIPKPNDPLHCDKYVYYPDKFETMSQAKIRSFQTNYVLKFIFWSMFNRSKITDEGDKRILISRFIDINSYTMGVIFTGLTVNRLLSRVDVPFLQMLLEDFGIPSSALRKGLVLGASAFALYTLTRQIGEHTYLYDIALKYKEAYKPNYLVSSNIEKVFRGLSAQPESN